MNRKKKNSNVYNVHNIVQECSIIYIYTIYSIHNVRIFYKHIIEERYSKVIIVY